MNLFTQNIENNAPLADKMRPQTLDEFLGQEHIVGKNTLLRRAIIADKLGSVIFWGPAGCGKSTLAYIIAKTTNSNFFKLNAVTSGVKEVREIIDKAKASLEIQQKPSFLLLDECHRWSKTQSDSILPAVESGIIKLVGSTTQNPMAAMTSAIISRCRLFEFYALEQEHIVTAIKRALKDKEKGFGNTDVIMEEDAINHIARVSGGDVRTALNALELAVLSTPPNIKGEILINIEIAEQSIQSRAIRMDENEYYNMLSAFCKSLRGCDSDAALFWFARMMYAGVDPKVPVRRMIVHASEDVGLANPSVLNQCVSAMQALEFIGMPEARLNIAQAIIFLCESPKSNSVLMAIESATKDAREVYDQKVPVHLQDANYNKAKYNTKEYIYPHEYPHHYVKQQYLPDELQNKKYYKPSNEGYEKKIQEFRKYISKEE